MIFNIILITNITTTAAILNVSVYKNNVVFYPVPLIFFILHVCFVAQPWSHFLTNNDMLSCILINDACV